MNTQMIYRIKIYCEEKHLFSEGEQVLIGLSGGADSVFLAYAMKELEQEWRLHLHLVHVNHGIRGREAERDEEFCRSLARKLELPVTIFHGNVPELAKEKGMSEEEAGRFYRYQCMEELRLQLDFDKIAVAHHQDDQAETVLFQLLRGSGLRGAGGMRPVRDRIVRPLLTVRRREIEEELRRLGQSWCEDSTNQELMYSRNQLRHRVIPYLEREVAPGTVVHLAHTAGQMQEVFDYLTRETMRIYGQLVKAKKDRLEMETAEFCQLHSILQKELVMRLFEQVAGSRRDITSRHVEAVCSLASGPTGKRLTLPYGMKAGKDYHIVWLEKELPRKKLDNRTERPLLPAPEQEGWQGQTKEADLVWQPEETQKKVYFLLDSNEKKSRIVLEKLSLCKVSGQNMRKVPKNSCTKWFDYARINGMLEFRHPQEGDYFLLDLDGNRKKLSRFLIDQKISLERRKRLWVLAMEAHVVWIPELGRSSAGFYVTEDTEEVLCASYERKQDSLQR